MIDPDDKSNGAMNAARVPSSGNNAKENSAIGELNAVAKPNPAPPDIEPEKLSAEEQMDRFEEYLRETDCGHRPC